MTFIRAVLLPFKNTAYSRFELQGGQFFSTWIFKNLWWTLDGNTIGYGDLQEEHIKRIQKRLNPGEIFEGWNEHHGTSFQQTDKPMIIITRERIVYPHRREDNYPIDEDFQEAKSS